MDKFSFLSSVDSNSSAYLHKMGIVFFWVDKLSLHT